MASKGGRGHLKRPSAPAAWPIHRKEYKWVRKPTSGPHSSKNAIPIEVILRDELKIAKTSREVKRVLADGRVKVDGRIVRDAGRPLGLMDVLEIPDAKMTFRVLPVQSKGLSLHRIPKDEAKFKLCKIQEKTTVGTGKVQFHLHDGRCIISTSKDGEASYRQNDTLSLGLPSQRVINHIKLAKGNFAMVVRGQNLARRGKIVELQDATATRPGLATLEDPEGKTFHTVTNYLFVLGEDKPTISLEA